MTVQLPRHLGEDNGLPGAGEQAMAALFFHPGAGGHVRHVALHSRGFRPLPCGDVLGVAATGAGFVVLEVAEFRDEQGHDFLLFLPTQGLLKGDHAVGPFDFLYALPPQSFQLLLVNLAHGSEDVLDHCQLHRQLEQQPPHAVGTLVHDALHRGGDDTAR